MSDSRGRGVLVTSYGGIPWMRHLAGALAAAGLLDRFVSPVITTPDRERRLQRWLPGAVSSRLLKQLRLRGQPSDVAPDQLVEVARGIEVLRVSAERASAPYRINYGLYQAAARAFDRGVARLLTGHEKAVIAYSGAAQTTLETARRLGVHGILDYPIAHHLFSERLLQEEARLVPEFAPTLQFHRFTGPVRRRMEREIDLADRILMLSSFHRDTFLEAGVSADKLVTIPLGVNLELFQPGDRPPADRFRVLFAGQISQRKGISYLLDGFERAAIDDAELVMLGRPVGPTDPWIRRRGVQHRPPVPFPSLPEHYRSAHVLVLPSLVEGFPLVAAQAMACGLPVIVSENAFGGDVITDGENGYVVPIRDAGAIAERLRHLHDNPAERERIGSAARKRAEEFSWERYGERIAELVRSLP